MRDGSRLSFSVSVVRGRNLCCNCLVSSRVDRRWLLLTDEFQHRRRKTRGLGLGLGCEQGNQQPSSEIKLCRNRCRCEGRLKLKRRRANRMSIIIKTFAPRERQVELVGCKPASGLSYRTPDCFLRPGQTAGRGCTIYGLCSWSAKSFMQLPFIQGRGLYRMPNMASCVELLSSLVCGSLSIFQAAGEAG